MNVRKEDLVPGEQYLFIMDDCCVEGEFYATFRAWDEEHEFAILDIGRIGPDWGAWEVQELEQTS